MLLCAVPLLAALSALPIASSDDAEALRASIRPVPSVRYAATYRRTLSLALETWVVEGRVLVTGADARPPRALRIDARVQPPRDGAAFDVTLACESGRWTLVDHGARTVTRSADLRLLGPTAETVAPLAVAVLGDRSAFERMDEVLRLEPTSYAGETCDVFRVRTRADASETKWYVSRESRLPRLVTGVRWLPAAERLVESLRLTDLVVGGGVQERAFAPEVPAGFEERPPLEPAQLETPERARQVVHSLTDTVEPLREHFAAARGKPRLIGLFAPT